MTNIDFPAIATDGKVQLNLPRAGLAVDIDEVLSDTMLDWVTNLFETFGNAEYLTPREFIAKYRYIHQSPYARMSEFESWRFERKHSSEIVGQLEVIAGAPEGLQEVSVIVPISCYLTARPPVVIDATREWLTKHRFPEAPIVHFPGHMPHEISNKWKVKLLMCNYPMIKGLVDDHTGLLPAFPQSYPGSLFLFDHTSLPPTPLRAYACPTWSDVVEKAREAFASQ